MAEDVIFGGDARVELNRLVIVATEALRTKYPNLNAPILEGVNLYGVIVLMKNSGTFSGVTFQEGDYLIGTETGWKKTSNENIVEEFINGYKLSQFGVIMLSGSYAALMKPAALKEWVSNENVTEDGTDYLAPSRPLVAERSVSLHFGMSKDNQKDFLDAYNRFITLLQSGIIDLYVPQLSRHYFLKYETCSSFNNYVLKACEIAVKFTEPNPRKMYLTA